MTSLVFDIIAAALIVAFAVVGLVRGFVKTFFGLTGFLIAIVLALVFTEPLADVLREKTVEPALSAFFLDRLSDETLLDTSQIDFSELPEGAEKLFSRFGVTPEELAEQLSSAGKTKGTELAKSLASSAVSHAAETLSRAIAFLLIFVTASLLVIVLTHVLDLVARVPGLRLPNRIFGLLTGIAQGFAIAFVLARVLFLLEPSMRGSGYGWLEDFSVENTFLIRTLCGR